MLSLLLAGGSFLGAVSQPVTTTEVETFNHTLRGERIMAKEVVCRSRWGTPMLPTGKGGYSLIAPINQEFIERSLFQPPLSTGVAYRPATVTLVVPTPVP